MLTPFLCVCVCVWQLFRRVAAALPGMEQTEPKRGNESILSGFWFPGFWFPVS